MAGMAGFEPTHAGVKVLCLTAWRHPHVIVRTPGYKKRNWNGVGEGIRTLDLQSHNLTR